MNLPCSECGKSIPVSNIKYHTPDRLNVFCDAYCSNAWYDKTFRKMTAEKDQTEKQ